MFPALITHIDTIPTATINHSELHRALQGPEYSSVSLDVADLQGNAQTICVLRSPPKTSQISSARAVKPLRDRRRELQETIRGLTKDEERESASLSILRCPILGKADVADTLLLTEWLDKLRKVEGHVASLELAHARPTLVPSMGGSRESLIRRQRTLALLHDRAEVVAHRPYRGS